MCRDGYDVVVIGAGLVGGAIAYGLARAGQRLAFLGEEDATYRASRGNFGLVWVQGKGLGRPEYARWPHMSSERWFELSEALVEDCALAPCCARPDGVVPALFGGRALRSRLDARESEAGGRQRRLRLYEMLGHARVRELLPACGPAVSGGAYTPYDGHADPLKFMLGLHAWWTRPAPVSGGKESPCAEVYADPAGLRPARCAAAVFRLGVADAAPSHCRRMRRMASGHVPASSGRPARRRGLQAGRVSVLMFRDSEMPGNRPIRSSGASRAFRFRPLPCG